MFSQGFLLLLLASSIAGFDVAEYLPQTLNPRAATAGGWALVSTTCPVDSTLCSYEFCCPSSLTCVHIGTGNHCCPAGTSCQSAYVASPQCADDSWSLWNATTAIKGRGYFCCLPGQIGTNTGTCVTGNTPVVSTLSAQLLSSAVGVGAVASSSSSLVSSATTKASSGAGSGASTSASPPTSNVIPAASTPGVASPTASQPPAQTSKSSAMRSVVLGEIAFGGVLSGLLSLFLGV